MPYQILVVDDSIAMRKVLKKLLQLSDFPLEDVMEASNGSEGLEKMRSQPVDLVISDLEMPGMDGWELVEEMSRDPHLQGVPVVAVSGSADKRLTEAIAKKNFRDFLIKPFDIDRLKETLSSILTEPKAMVS